MIFTNAKSRPPADGSILPTAVKARTALYLMSKLDGSELKDARTLLDAMSEQDVVSWSVLVSGNARLANSH
ncbi:hypothetical protein RHGRI_003799 [Rhododendron griersonianum]|uniref:Uncharacterized protein n=1 Tax=Rhododendron griersonianum TaxID=479676 RepID=A0AAV6L983_9ERIC|nr:hypothetical protein RHGRI_003799 [Rhododendron griersonianum]